MLDVLVLQPLQFCIGFWMVATCNLIYFDPRKISWLLYIHCLDETLRLKLSFQMLCSAFSKYWGKNRVRNKKVTPSNKLENCQSGERKKVLKNPIWAAFGFLLHLYCCFDGSVKRKQSNIVFSIKFSFLFKNVSIYKSLGSLLLHSMWHQDHFFPIS